MQLFVQSSFALYGDVLGDSYPREGGHQFDSTASACVWNGKPEANCGLDAFKVRQL